MRRGGSSKALVWGTGGLLAVVLGLTAYSALSNNGDHGHPDAQHGGTSSPSGLATGQATAPAQPVPETTYNVSGTWTDPQRWLALPRGAQITPGGDQTGFPDTTEGAVAMLVASNAVNVQGNATVVDRQLAIYRTYFAAADQSPANEQKVRDGAVRTDALQRSSIGLPGSGPLPSGAFVRSNVVGYKVLQASPSQVTAYLLTKMAGKASETAPEKDTYVVAVIGAAWDAGDWKLSLKATSDAVTQSKSQEQPPIAAPGDVAFNSAGWTAIRQAS